MGDVRSGDNRLPWLESPRPTPKAPPAARRARTPLLALLGLFFFSAIAGMAYLTGRSTAPAATSAPEESLRAASPVAPVRAPAPTPLPPTPIAPPVPVVTAPAPPVAAPVRAVPAKPRATRPTTKRKASVRRSSARQSTRQSTRRPERAVLVHRNTSLPRAAAVPQRRTVWPARPFAGPRGRVIQLGAYRTQAQADAAWWRVARAYPYLSTLPRVVTAIGPSRGRARYYRVRLAAGSGREARALCSNLHRIGRGCRIV